MKEYEGARQKKIFTPHSPESLILLSGEPWYEEQVALDSRYDWLDSWTKVFTVVYTDKEEDMDKV